MPSPFLFLPRSRSTIILKDGKIVKELRGVSSGGHADDVFAALKEVTAV